MQARVSAEPTIRFGQFELALKSGELRKSGALVRLQPQPFKVLAFLAAHPGQLVTRDELRQAIWEEDTFVDFEHGLNFCIKAIRAALGDSAQSPSYIETLPRRGYRFIAEVEERESISLEQIEPPIIAEPEILPASGFDPVESLPDPVRQIPARATVAPRAAYKRSLLPALGIAIVIMAAVLIWRGSHPTGVTPVTPTGKLMIAVLPFEDLSPAQDQNYFSDGLTEEMIAQLGSLQPQRLGVIARTSAMTYKATSKDIRQIGRELGVAYVLEGSVRRDGDQVRITAQLIQVSDQTHLWSESYERNLSGILSIQSEVAARIAQSLAFELLPPGSGDANMGGTSVAEAHEAYLRGRYLWNKGRRGDLKQSVEYFEQATALDPKYALAFAGAADSYRLMGMNNVAPPPEVLTKSLAAALKAVSLDDSLGAGHAALGSYRFWYERNWSEAEKEFLRAIELNPSYGPAHHDYAWLLIVTGRAEEGVAQIKRAQELDPLSPVANSDVGWALLFARHYDEAITQMKRTLELEPNSLMARACMEQAYLARGMYREAVAAAKQSLALSRTKVDLPADIDSVDPTAAIRLLQQERLKAAEAKSETVAPFTMAGLYAAIGDRDRAFDSLTRAFENHDLMLVTVGVDPTFDNLRSDSRFGSLIERLGLRN